MRFGPTPLSDLPGAVLAHSVRLPDGVLLKGRPLGPADVERLRRHGISTVEAVHLEPGDLPENEAARVVVDALHIPDLRTASATTGRANLHAGHPGLFGVDAARLAAANAIDEAVTISTLPDQTAVAAGRLVATVKIIPFAVQERIVNAVVQELVGAPPLSLHRFQVQSLGLIVTTLPHEPERRADLAVSAVQQRVEGLGATLDQVVRTAHERQAVARAIREQRDRGVDLLLLFGASQTSDRLDVLPQALEHAGGRLLRLGIPADPGNLVFFGRIDGTPVLGVPGCVRSPSRSGFEPVLERTLAGLPLDAHWFSSLGAGGLYKESLARGQPRLPTPGPGEGARIAGVLLAAGRSTRMGEANKLTTVVGEAALVARAADALLGSGVDPIVVVTGHDAPAITAELGSRAVRVIHNPNFAAGLSTSVRTGLRALDTDRPDGVVIALADMPFVRSSHIDQLIAAFAPNQGRSICVPVFDRKRGNPVLWGARHFAAMQELEGDSGARDLLRECADAVIEVAVDDPGILLDVDTPDALRRAQADPRLDTV